MTNAGTEHWRATSIHARSRRFPAQTVIGPIQPHIAEWIRVNAEYVKAGVGKDRERMLCEAGIRDGEPCRYPARPNRKSCGREHDR